MSFWRYKLLELLVALATFPLAVVAFVLWARIFTQFADLASGGPIFFAFAVPFMVVWVFAFNRLTKRAKKWWIARHQNADESAGKAMRR